MEKVSGKLETKKKDLSPSQDGYETLTFSSTEEKDLSTVLSCFDHWSEGYYVIYIFSQGTPERNESSVPLFDHPPENFLLKFSVHSDATLFEFEFKDASAYNRLIRLIK